MPAAAAGRSLATAAADDTSSPEAAAAERMARGQHGADGGTAAAPATAVAAPPGTTWVPTAKARAALAAAAARTAADHAPRVTGAANIARTFAARAHVIPAELLPARAPEEKSAPVCGAMDAFVTRAHGTDDATAGVTEGLARVHERRGGAVRVKVCLSCVSVLVPRGGAGEGWDGPPYSMRGGSTYRMLLAEGWILGGRRPVRVPL